MFVHAHPDDETINDGATMALYTARGVAVTLVTCTRGEQGEVIPPSLAHLAPGPGEVGHALGEWREGELAAALSALGVTRHRFLGYVDSGMAYDADGAVVPAPWSPPDAFALAPVAEAAERLAAVLLQERPDAVVGYGPDGGYGHPDHVQAHRVAMRAAELAGVPRAFWTVREDGAPTVRVDATAYLPAKVAAMRAHATQLAVDPEGTTFALSNGERFPIEGVEWYRQVAGDPSPPNALLD